jgi:hypothetical protein
LRHLEAREYKGESLTILGLLALDDWNRQQFLVHVGVPVEDLHYFFIGGLFREMSGVSLLLATVSNCCSCNNDLPREIHDSAAAG